MAKVKAVIAGRAIFRGAPAFIVAEAGVNHNGELRLAKQLVDAAVAAGADCVKFQTFKAEQVISAGARKAAYQMGATGKGESQLEMVKKLELPFEAFRELRDYCRERQILFLSTPFDSESVDFLAELDVPAFKVPSGDLTNFPYLVRVARHRKPIILSTGMATLQEVQAAVDAIKEAGNHQVILLHCVSGYPADPCDMNLRALATMEETLRLPVGLSDHTSGIEVALAAVALGACVIEKHFTISRDLPGPDHRASLEPEELAALVRGIRKVESALGDGVKRPAPCEANTAAVVRKSLVAACDISAGTVLERDMVAIKRPGTGLPPIMVEAVIGRRTRVPISRDALISLDMLV